MIGKACVRIINTKTALRIDEIFLITIIKYVQPIPEIADKRNDYSQTTCDTYYATIKCPITQCVLLITSYAMISEYAGCPLIRISPIVDYTFVRQSDAIIYSDDLQPSSRDKRNIF